MKEMLLWSFLCSLTTSCLHSIILPDLNKIRSRSNTSQFVAERQYTFDFQFFVNIIPCANYPIRKESKSVTELLLKWVEKS